MNLTVIGPRVFIRPDDMPAMTEDGLLHIVYDRQHVTMKGTVVALGDGPRSPKGQTLDHIVHIGDRVLFSSERGEELIFEREVLLSLLEDDVLAIID